VTATMRLCACCTHVTVTAILPQCDDEDVAVTHEQQTVGGAAWTPHGPTILNHTPSQTLRVFKHLQSLGGPRPLGNASAPRRVDITAALCYAFVTMCVPNRPSLRDLLLRFDFGRADPARVEELIERCADPLTEVRNEREVVLEDVAAE
jgi:hypothetical protein